MPRTLPPRSSAPSRKAQVRTNGPAASAHIPRLGGTRKEALQARSRETVSAILEAAARLLVETGYRSASTNAIAKRAGVSIGSLYQFFGSREDVFRTLIERHKAEVHACAVCILMPVLEGEREAAEVLPELLDALIELHRPEPALAWAMATQLAHLQTDADRQRDSREVADLVEHMASRLQGPRGLARARSWMAAEITMHLTRCLSHEPPDSLEREDVKAVFRAAMRELLG